MLLDPDEILVDSVSVLSRDDILEGKIERPLGRFSSFMFLFCVIAGMAYLAYRAAFLQVVSGETFFQKSQENRFVTRPIFPPRGIIYDRFGDPMVENTPSFTLVFEKDKFLAASGDLKTLIKEMSVALQKDNAFFFELGFPEDYDIKKVASRISILRNVPQEMMVTLVPRIDFFPGVQMVESYRRVYASPFAFSHLIGYVGKISDDDLKLNPELKREEGVGKAGIEAFYDEILRGKGGKKIIEVNSQGVESRFRLTEKPQEGVSLFLTIDQKLQDVVYEIVQGFTEMRRGASVVVIDPRSGAVRALLSFPGFDVNRFGSQLSNKEFNSILNDRLTPLFNRAIAGEFPSGSTLKPLIAAAALEENLIDPNKYIYDEGYIEIPNPYVPGQKSVFKDWRKHGSINFYDAIAWSANVYFYMIGGGFKDQKGLGIERIKKYALAFGLGSQLGIDIPGEKAGFIPDPQSKVISDPEDPIWRIGDTYNVSIGQGGVRTTPLQMASLVATVGNGGKLYKPYILEKAVTSDGKVIKKQDPILLREQVVSEKSLREVQKGMRETVVVGTARMLQAVPVSVAAKTGTAQAGAGLPHAWITAYAPAQNPEIAIVVMVEHAGEGSTVAGPITREILNWYFTHRNEEHSPD